MIVPESKTLGMLLQLFEIIMRLADWTQISSSIRKTLSEMALVYIRSEEIENDSQVTRDNFAFHLYVLDNLVESLSNCAAAKGKDKTKMFNELIRLNTGYEGESLEILNALQLQYIRSQRIQREPMEVRKQISYHFSLLKNVMEKMMSYNDALDKELLDE